MVRKLSAEECQAAMTAGEFSPGILASAPAVAIILTQSWCPQWMWMKTYLGSFKDDQDIAICTIEYDKESFFEDFMAFKENTFGNDQVPYLRYYRDGKLIHESNYIDKGGFLRFLKS